MQIPKEIKGHLDRDGRLSIWPAKEPKRVLVLAYLAEKMDATKRYSEREINEFLNTWHVYGDPATLRRELFDRGFVDREPDGSAYWRR